MGHVAHDAAHAVAQLQDDEQGAQRAQPGDLGREAAHRQALQPGPLRQPLPQQHDCTPGHMFVVTFLRRMHRCPSAVKLVRLACGRRAWAHMTGR